MKRRWLAVALVLVIGVCGAVWLWSRTVTTQPSLRSDRPFTDLSTALAESPPGWELYIPPPNPGPYRMVPGGSMLGIDIGVTMTCRVTDDDGVVVEELRLKGDPAFDQYVVRLETPEGRQTMVALKRPR